MIWALVVLCLVWWISGALVLRNVAQARRLDGLPLVERERWPSLTVIAPARNEAGSLAQAMSRRLRSGYPDLEILIIDDRSEDGTGAVADELAAADRRLRVIHNEVLPQGWLGKVHALSIGAREARGEWLLFSDADTVVAPGTLRRVIHHCEERGLDVLAALPTITAAGPLMGGLHSMFLRVLFLGIRPRAVEDPRSRAGVGVGAFTLVRRRALEATPGFEALRLEVADDLMLGVMLKRSGARCTVVNGAVALEVDLYPRLRDFVSGAEKNAWAVSAGFSLIRGLAAAGLFLAFDLAPLALVTVGGSSWPGLFGALTALWAFALSMAVLRANGRRPWAGLLYPVGTVVFVYAAVRGTLLGWWRGGLRWRDTFYPTAAFLEARRARRQA